MSNPFNLSRDHRLQSTRKEQTTIPFDAPDVIKPTRLVSSQNSGRRRTMTGADMMNSQPLTSTPASNLKRNRMDIPDDLDSVRYKEPRIYSYSDEPSARRPHVEDPLYFSQQQYRPHPREEQNIYDHHSSQTEQTEKIRTLQANYDILLKNYTTLFELNHTAADEVARTLSLNEQYREEAYAQLEKAVKKLASVKGSGNEEHNTSVERLQEEKQILQEENLRLQEQLKKQSQRKDSSSAINSEEMNGIFALFEGLTGLKVLKSKRAKDGELFECVINGIAATHKFIIFIPTDKNKSIEYTPTSENAQLLSSILPDFLLEEIDFSRDYLPLFFSKLSSSIHSRSG